MYLIVLMLTTLLLFIKTMRVKGYPHSALILTLIAESAMNKGIQAYCEGVRVKSMKNFFRKVVDCATFFEICRQ